MKRILITIAATAALGASPAFGFEANFDYSGHVSGDPAAGVGFHIEKTDSGHRRVIGFTVSQMAITCSDSDQTRSTDGYQFDPGMRVKHRKFAGAGDWTVLTLDPSGSVAGKFHPDGTVSGTLRLHGELAGADTHCHTGELKWKAAKQQPSPKALTKHRFEAPLQQNLGNNGGVELNAYYKHHVPKFVTDLEWQNIDCGGNPSPFAGVQHWSVDVNANGRFHKTHLIQHAAAGSKVRITGKFINGNTGLRGTFELLPTPGCPGGTGTLKYKSG